MSEATGWTVAALVGATGLLAVMLVGYSVVDGDLLGVRCDARVEAFDPVAQRLAGELPGTSAYPGASCDSSPLPYAGVVTTAEISRTERAVEARGCRFVTRDGSLRYYESAWLCPSDEVDVSVLVMRDDFAPLGSRLTVGLSWSDGSSAAGGE